MALRDIIERIAAEAQAEVRGLAEAAEAESQAIVAAAREQAETELARSVERARVAAEAEAETILANARLVARDRALAARQALMAEVMAQVAGRLVELPAVSYVAMFAARVAAVARSGETVRVAPADRTRLAGLREGVAKLAPDLSLEWSDEPAAVDHGVVLTGDRVTVDLSVASILSDRKDAIDAVIASVLFGESSG